ncbi:MAG: LD-carboxypeptidase [Muribaculaceae bacterium]|nr:LD-carboxypeptidase [Muribaculaceae bacterium]
MKTLIPKPLKTGDRIAVVSPAGIIKPQNVYRALPYMEEQGWQPYVTPNTFKRYGTFAGTPDQRYSDLEEAFLDPSTRAILCSRGGYGVVHLLERLSRLNLRRDPKWVIGYSDISALHGLMASQGIASIHSPMAKHIADQQGEDPYTKALFNILKGKGNISHTPSHPLNRPGSVSGTLYGGNLAVLTGLIGTKYDILRPNTILFIEDVSEPIYKIERMMYSLRLSGVLARIKGLIVGQFTEYSPDVDNETMEDMISRCVAPYNYPVMFNAPVGHVDQNVPLIEGGRVTLTVGSDTSTIDQSKALQ